MIEWSSDHEIEKMRSIFAALEEPFRFFSFLTVLADHSDSPTGERGSYYRNFHEERKKRFLKSR